VSKESLWILENPKLHISMRVGTPAELSVKQSIWKNGTFERNIQINILFFNIGIRDIHIECSKQFK
jgi:hypothetical protein